LKKKEILSLPICIKGKDYDKALEIPQTWFPRMKILRQLGASFGMTTA
jgi:hypothetical protein